MNNRIKELAKQAGMVYDDPEQGQFDYFNEQQFAKLLIEECLSVQNKCPHHIAAGKFVRDHFGIKK